MNPRKKELEDWKRKTRIMLRIIIVLTMVYGASINIFERDSEFIGISNVLLSILLIFLLGWFAAISPRRKQ